MAEINEGGDLAEKLQSVMQDPARMGQLMQMANSLLASGVLSGGVTPSGTETPSEPQEAAASEQTAAGDEESYPQLRSAEPVRQGTEKLAGAHPKPHGNHAQLLHALRPYMSDRRRDRIDQILRLLQMAELAGAMMQMQPPTGTPTPKE